MPRRAKRRTAGGLNTGALEQPFQKQCFYSRWIGLWLGVFEEPNGLKIALQRLRVFGSYARMGLKVRL